MYQMHMKESHLDIRIIRLFETRVDTTFDSTHGTFWRSRLELMWNGSWGWWGQGGARSSNVTSSHS